MSHILQLLNALLLLNQSKSLMAGYHLYWSGSNSTHSPLSRLTALTSRKHFQSTDAYYWLCGTVVPQHFVVNFLHCRGDDQSRVVSVDIHSSSSSCWSMLTSTASPKVARISQWLNDPLKIKPASPKGALWLMWSAAFLFCSSRGTVINHKYCNALFGFTADGTHCTYRFKWLLWNFTFFFFPQVCLQRHILQQMSAYSQTSTFSISRVKEFPLGRF